MIVQLKVRKNKFLCAIVLLKMTSNKKSRSIRVFNKVILIFFLLPNNNFLKCSFVSNRSISPINIAFSDGSSSVIFKKTVFGPNIPEKKILTLSEKEEKLPKIKNATRRRLFRYPKSC